MPAAQSSDAPVLVARGELVGRWDCWGQEKPLDQLVLCQAIQKELLASAKGKPSSPSQSSHPRLGGVGGLGTEGILFLLMTLLNLNAV